MEPNPDPHRRVSLRDIAKHLGVSHVTVSLALRDNTRISKALREKVRQTAEELGYRPDPMLMALAQYRQGKKVAPTVSAMIVPGSGLVKEQAEKEGLDKIFLEAGFEWREPGCSMCLAMNDDRLAPGERCASTSNRNFEGRQGFKGRTHLVSPAMAAAAAIAGHFVDVREL